MANATKRRAHTQTIFDTLGLDVEYVKAVDFEYERNALSIPTEIVKNMHTLKDVGCWLSHLRVWKDMIQKNYQTAFILEDDMDMPLDIHSHIRKGLSIIDTQNDIFSSPLSHLNNNNKGPRKHNEWHAIFPGQCSYKEQENPPIDPSYSLLRKAVGPLCTHAYIIHQRGAREFLKRFGKYIKEEIDQVIAGDMRNNTLFGYSYEPPIITQRRDLVDFSFISYGFFRFPPKSTLEFVRKYGDIYTENDVILMGLEL